MEPTISWSKIHTLQKIQQFIYNYLDIPLFLTRLIIRLYKLDYFSFISTHKEKYHNEYLFCIQKRQKSKEKNLIISFFH